MYYSLTIVDDVVTSTIQKLLTVKVIIFVKRGMVAKATANKQQSTNNPALGTIEHS